MIGLVASFKFAILSRGRQWLYRMLRDLVKPVVQDIMINDVQVFGTADRISIAATAEMVNTLFNTVSGRIEVGDYTFAGHNVSLLTGTHDYRKADRARMDSAPRQNRDIIVGRGVWIGSNAVIVGPCRIGNNSVIAAGAIVTDDVPANVIVAGVPAKIIRHLEFAHTVTRRTPS